MAALRSRPRIAPRTGTAAIIAAVVGAVFALPLIAMLEFTLRDTDGGHSLDHWIDLFTPANAAKFRVVWLGLQNSLVLAVVTVVIMLALLVPTTIFVALRLPRWRRALEFVCLLPISIPAIVLVVGLAPVYQVIGRSLGTGVWSLAFAYGITVLPFTYRAIQSNLDAIDVRTLSEAARTLGASWLKVVLRVLVPNLRQGILAASLITVAVVLGEFTIASLLGRQNLQTALVVINKQDPYISIIVALLALMFSFVLLLVIGRFATVGESRRSSRR